MTMHLLPPLFSTTKTSKRHPKKWKSSSAKKRSNELNSSWEAILAKHAPKPVTKKVKPLETASRYVDPARSTRNIPSKDSGGYSTARIRNEYTGDKMIGIAAMHKSNLVPIFNDDSAKEVARMRRG